jgi:hypothetical protein
MAVEAINDWNKYALEELLLDANRLLPSVMRPEKKHEWGGWMFLSL